MTITSMPIAANPTISSAPIGNAVMAMSLDTAKEAGQGMIKMMEQSVAPNLGQNIDFMV